AEVVPWAFARRAAARIRPGPRPGRALVWAVLRAVDAALYLVQGDLDERAYLPLTRVPLAVEAEAEAAAPWAGEAAWAEAADRCRAGLCHLVRDIFGNPFRPVRFDPAWRTAAAVSLARGMYRGRDFGRLTDLADARQDAGCDTEAVLTHCHRPRPHVRGCWAVDLVLGKA